MFSKRLYVNIYSMPFCTLIIIKSGSAKHCKLQSYNVGLLCFRTHTHH